jgi:hypothetical protein
MNSAILACSKCGGALLPEGLWQQDKLAPCPSCGASVQIEIFPALFRPMAAGQAGEAVIFEGESSCFYHPQKKAVVHCQGCGRFLCALCDCELHGEHFCPGCLEVGRIKGKIRRLENQRVLYDDIALAVAILPLLIFYFTLITAPIALYMALRYWNAPRSIVHRTKWRFVLAIVFAVLELAGWGVGAYLLVTRSGSHG